MATMELPHEDPRWALGLGAMEHCVVQPLGLIWHGLLGVHGWHLLGHLGHGEQLAWSLGKLWQPWRQMAAPKKNHQA